MMSHHIRRWTNPSVMALAAGSDPIEVIQSRARQTVFEAADKGWQGPPFDPFELAELLSVRVLPNGDVLDARLVPSGSDDLTIEFNPDRPHGRIRYSVAHELAHTLFPDCANSVRNRLQRGMHRDDEWQLELLCNIGAAEILMPSGYTDLENEAIDIDNLLRLRREFDVSVEALLIRITKITSQSCAMFAAARVSDTDRSSGYRIDYNVPSRSWRHDFPTRFAVDAGTILGECTAVGFTAKTRERWSDSLPSFNVECVGIPAFPGNRFPRVAGILTASDEEAVRESHQIIYLFGDARDPRGAGPQLIVHIVNDRTPNWGGGFALEVKKKWKTVQDDFRMWVSLNRENLTLGNIHLSHIEGSLSIVHMIAQRGYGPSKTPRIRYAALSICLNQVAELALKQGATVHMPRIGTGQAGGQWAWIRELIDDRLVRRGVPVFVYELPDSVPVDLQGLLHL